MQLHSVTASMCLVCRKGAPICLSAAQHWRDQGGGGGQQQSACRVSVVGLSGYGSQCGASCWNCPSPLLQSIWKRADLSLSLCPSTLCTACSEQFKVTSVQDRWLNVSFLQSDSSKDQGSKPWTFRTSAAVVFKL